MPVILQALAEHHIFQILEPCQDWQELAQLVRRTGALVAVPNFISRSPTPLATARYYLHLRPSLRCHLVGEMSVYTTIYWRNRVAQIGICTWVPKAVDEVVVRVPSTNRLKARGKSRRCRLR